jgi:hypothetical protein
MINVHPQYIRDAEGNKTLVVLSVKEFEALIEDLEDLDDIKLYDKAKKEDDGERIPFSEYLKKRKAKNG